MCRRQEEFTRSKAQFEEKERCALERERERKRKQLFFLRQEEERLQRLHEEEEARKREEAERHRNEEAAQKAKLDEISEKQRQREREVEEKERPRREALLGKSTEVTASTSQLPTRPLESAPATAAPSTAGKYVPRFQREKPEIPAQGPPSESERWASSRQAPAQTGRWDRSDDRNTQPSSDKWHHDDRKSSFGGGRSRGPSRH